MPHRRVTTRINCSINSMVITLFWISYQFHSGVFMFTELFLHHCLHQFTVWVNSLSGSIHCLDQFTVWVNSLSGSIHCLGQFTVLVNSLSGSIHFLGQFTVLVKSLSGSIRGPGSKQSGVITTTPHSQL